jgi:hypothetical protein
VVKTNMSVVHHGLLGAGWVGWIIQSWVSNPLRMHSQPRLCENNHFWSSLCLTGMHRDSLHKQSTPSENNMDGAHGSTVLCVKKLQRSSANRSQRAPKSFRVHDIGWNWTDLDFGRTFPNAQTSEQTSRISLEKAYGSIPYPSTGFIQNTSTAQVYRTSY